MIGSAVATLVILWAVSITGASTETQIRWIEFHRHLCLAEPLSVNWRAERGRISAAFICYQAGGKPT